MRKPVTSTLTEQVLVRSLPVWLALAIALALAPGCTRHVFMTEKVYEDATNRLSYDLENNPTAGVMPISAPVAAPPTADFPERPPRFMTLPEAIAIALENGNVSSQGQGLSVDDLVGLGRGPLNAQSQRVRVLALAPAIAETNIEASLARFDAKWITTVGWTTTDNLVNGLADFQNGTSATVNSTVVKAFASGGIMNVSAGALNPGPFSGSYTNLRNPPNGVINNVYNMPITVGFEQPLWQNFGVGINQLLNQVAPSQGITMPGQAAAYFNNNSRLPLTQGPSFAGLATQGILLARLQFDLQRAEFEQQINQLLQNTEVAYWRLYQAYGQLYSWDEALKTALTGWRFTKSKTQQELEGTGAQELFLTQALYEEFRGERLKALGQVLDAERNLRGILGLANEDGSRIVPITAPTVAPYQPNWEAAVQDALALRPELIMARENLRNQQFTLEITKNFLKPDLRATGFIQPTGWGTRLDGNGTMNETINGTVIPRTSNAFRSLARADWNNWTVGMTLNVPLGWRLEHAAVRSARLQLAQAYYVLEDQEEKAKRLLSKEYQKLNEFYRRIEIARAERKAYEQTVKAYWKLIETQFGKQFSPGNQAVVDAERRLALARLKEYEAIAEYNSTLCRFEWSKGTIQQYDNVVIAEGALPQMVQTRAVEHERMRSMALVLQERDRGPGPVDQPGMAFQNSQVPVDVAAPPSANSTNPDNTRLEPIPVQPRELKKPETVPQAPRDISNPGAEPVKDLAPGKQPMQPGNSSNTGKPDKSEAAPKSLPAPKVDAGSRKLEIPTRPVEPPQASPGTSNSKPSNGTPSNGTPGTIVLPEGDIPGLFNVPQRPTTPESGGRPIAAPPTTGPALPGSPIGPPPPLGRP
ncbi:MAG: hypothetical protein FJ271_08870 [Planctomycetes bacterium]|nr:hypothetical protein [Planctomycetota bacterium]